jgi:beta-galactosidase
MKTILIGLVVLLALASCSQKSEEAGKIWFGENNFDNGWKFLLDSIEGAENPAFIDSTWRTVDLPHDWSIEDLDKQKHPDAIGPFVKNSPGGVSTGHVLGETGWYRKHFNIENTKPKVVTLSFDGVYMLAEVWVNGKLAGTNNYGYSPFNFDITSLLNKAGEENVVAVRVKNPGKNSRWYSGSGIYRHVKLIVQGQINMPVWGTFITTPEVSKEKAKVTIQTTIRNGKQVEAKVTIKTKILDNAGNKVSESIKDTLIAAQSELKIGTEILVTNPSLWSCESPYLYTATQHISSNDKLLDSKSTTFGIRSIAFSAEKGFLLNGIETKLLGGCVHHDNGILGSAAFYDAEVHRIQSLKENGFNAIRTSHNPPSAAFLDACDRLGMLVMDEAFDMWEHPKTPQDYHLYFKTNAKKDLENMLLRDRNHPSVVIWSIGNEIYERGDTAGVRIGNYLKDIVKSLDTTRPVTAAICSFWDHPGYTWKNSIPAFEVLDVHGYNYQWKEYENDTKLFPNRIIIGTESTAAEALENYNLVESQKNVIGDFIWTGIDYLGESGIGHFYQANEKNEFHMPYPWFNGWCGDIDIIGNKKMQMYYRDVVWRNSLLELAVHSPENDVATEKISYWGWPNEEICWNWAGAEGKKLRVNVYTRCEKIRLELNGKTVGEKQLTTKDGITASFDIAYEAGELKAIGYKDGKVVAEKVIRTTGNPSKIRLVAEKNAIKADKGNLAYCRLEVTDNEGNLVPLAALPITFSVSGEATLAAAGTACPNCMESFTDNGFTTFKGKGIIILRSNGKAGTIQLDVKSEGLTGANLILKAEQ